jgi:hypothetical protein
MKFYPVEFYKKKKIIEPFQILFSLNNFNDHFTDLPLFLLVYVYNPVLYVHRSDYASDR